MIFNRNYLYLKNLIYQLRLLTWEIASKKLNKCIEKPSLLNRLGFQRSISFIFAFGIIRQQYNNEIDPNAMILISENDRRPLRYFKIDQKYVLFIPPTGSDSNWTVSRSRYLGPSTWSGYIVFDNFLTKKNKTKYSITNSMYFSWLYNSLFDSGQIVSGMIPCIFEFSKFSVQTSAISFFVDKSK